MILAIVDEESDLTYYEVKNVKMKGKVDANPVPEKSISSSLLEDRVLVWDSASSEYLNQNGFFGKALDEERLQLSLVESAYLLSKGLIEVENSRDDSLLDLDLFSEIASSIEPDFMNKLRAYSDLRDKGFVPKTGFKFGTHFRVYDQVTSKGKIPHSGYLVHGIPKDTVFALPVMSRAIRLANSVRKRMLYAVEERNGTSYVDIGRIKM